MIPSYGAYSSTRRLSLLITTLCASILCLLSGPASALDTIETKYFTIIFDESGSFTAGEIAQFCDESYENLMARYQAFDDNPRVLCIVNDSVDLANGFSRYYQNTITIYATNMDFELRGQSDWLRNVFVHEMTHMVSLKKAARGPVNFLLMGGGRYNDNPDLDIGLAWYHLSQPAWFSEGTAQLGAETFGSDRWDTHRDMMLRAAWFEDRLLNRDEMNVLTGRTGMEAELVYNQGYAMLRYIRDTYGYDAVVELNNRSGWFDFEPTIKDVLGISYEQLYSDWRASMDERYAPFRERVQVAGVLVADQGSTDYFPAVSPDGRYLAWLSNRNRDYAITDLMLTDRESGCTRRLVKNVDYRIAWSHDSSRLVYVKRPPRHQNLYDIFTYDIATDTERRLSRDMRAKDPSFSPDDTRIVFVKNEGGNTTLAMIEADGTGLCYLTNTGNGTQFHRPSFSPDGSRIVFGVYHQGLDRDIATIDAYSPSWRHGWDIGDSTTAFPDSNSFAEGADFSLLVASPADERDPVFLPDGGLLYSSDRTGVFNLYRLDPDTGRAARITDVSGGAFVPTTAPGGTVIYAGFTAGNFSLYEIPLDSIVESTPIELADRDYLMQPEPFDPSGHFTASPFTRKRILDAIVPTVNFGPSFIGSRFGLDVLDVGAEVYISDILGRDSFTLGGSTGRNVNEDVPLNNRVQGVYQRRMAPITSSAYTHAPTYYVQGYRSVINNLIDRYSGEADSVYVSDMPQYGYDNVLAVLNQKLSVADRYKHEFRLVNTGMFFPLASRHALTFDATFRSYIETVTRREVVTDRSHFLVEGSDITDDIPGTGMTYASDINFVRDMEYFRSSEFAISYQYFRSMPAADSDVMPRGTTFLARFKHMRTTLADSLVEQTQYQLPIGMYNDGYFAFSTYQPDPWLDDLRPLEKDVNLSEFTLLLQRFQDLPFYRHTLGGILYAGYRDIQLKDAGKGEGAGYNWPLKYYLGGRSMLRGYPYFSFWGSKLLYGRLSYTLPVKRRIGRNVLGLQFQRLYGSAFFEAGSVWNFRRLSTDELRKGKLKRDVGIELRLKMVTFYRLPAFLTLTVAWPLDDMNDSPYRDQRDPRRYYLSLRM